MRPSAIPGVGVTATVPVARSPLRWWAAALTRTARVRTASKPPVKASVRVAVVVPDAPPEMLPTLSPAMAGLVASAKLDFVTPAAKVVSSSATVTVAPLRLASVSAEGLVAETDAP